MLKTVRFSDSDESCLLVLLQFAAQRYPSKMADDAMSETTTSEEATWFNQLREGIADTDVEDAREGNNQDKGVDDETGKNKGGRPVKPDTEKKTERLTVAFTRDQRDSIERKAEEAGLSVAPFIRSAALEKDVTGKVDAETRRELRRIGADLKQITKVANASGEVQKAERLDIVLDAVNKAARSIQ